MVVYLPLSRACNLLRTCGASRGLASQAGPGSFAAAVRGNAIVTSVLSLAPLVTAKLAPIASAPALASANADAALFGRDPDLADALSAVESSWSPKQPPLPRTRRTIVGNISSIRTFLTEIGGRYSTLRQVTHDDITTWLAGRPGRSRPRDASTLRGLFAVLKAERLVFANPARGVRISRRNPSVPAPLPSHLLTATAAAAWRPATSVDSDHTRITGHRRNPDGDEVPEVRRRL